MWLAHLPGCGSHLVYLHHSDLKAFSLSLDPGWPGWPSGTLGSSFADRLGFPDGSGGKASACNVGDLGLIPGLGRSPREGNGNPLQYSCPENPVDRGAW